MLGEQEGYPVDATGPMMASLQREIEEMMGALNRVGDRRSAEIANSPHELAMILRLGSRLARTGGWVLAQREGSAEERAAAAVSLRRAAPRAADRAANIGPLSSLAREVDQLVARANRLQEMMSPSGTA